MSRTCKDYERSDSYYQSSLRLAPDSPNHTFNYAVFLQSFLESYEEAEHFYLKALGLEPTLATLNLGYAIFLKNISRDYVKAENYYKKAIALNSDVANCNGCYAQFLLESGRKKEADSYMDTAFESLTDEVGLELDLWFYRLAHYSEFQEQAKVEINRLLGEGHKSINWNFEGNIARAKKDGFKDIGLLERFAKEITEN